MQPTFSQHNYVGLCAIIRDSLDLRDFVDHYVSLGVIKIYIFDHNSSTPVIKQLRDYTEAGIVEYHYIEDIAACS